MIGLFRASSPQRVYPHVLYIRWDTVLTVVYNQPSDSRIPLPLPNPIPKRTGFGLLTALVSNVAFCC